MGSKLWAREPAQKGRHSELGRKKFAPLDGGIRARREWGSKPWAREPAQKGRHSELGREKFAPQDEGIRASGEWGANLGPGGRHRAGKSLLPWTEE